MGPLSVSPEASSLCHPKNLNRRRYHIAMAHNSMHVQVQLVKLELDSIVEWSSMWPVKDEEVFARYFERFWPLADHLVSFRAMSIRECNALFWQGLHSDDRSALHPYLLDKRPNQQPGATLNFQELFELAYPFIARKRLAAEAEASAKAEAEAETARQREAIRQVVQLMRNVQNEKLSIHDEAYDALYRRCAHIIPELAEVLPKPELSPEPMQDVALQSTSRDRQTPPAPSSLVRAPSPPVSETLSSPTDPAASALAAPVNPSPLTLARTLALSTASPSSPRAIGRPKGPRRIATITSRMPAAPASDRLSLTPPPPLVPPLPPSLTSLSPLPSLPPPPISPPLQLLPTPTAHELPPPPPLPSSPSPLSPSPSPSSLSPPPTPQVHERTPPPPSSITATPPKPSEATEAQPNNCRTQEQTDISSIRNNDANLITKPQVQVPRNNNHNPNNIEGNPTHDNSDSNHSSICDHDNHPGKPGNFSTSNDCKFVYDPGGSTFNPEDASTCDVGDSSSSTNVSCAADTFPTNAHCTDAPVLSLEATDNNEDFAQHALPCCDRRLTTRLRTGDFASTDSSRASAHTRLLAADSAPTHPTLHLNDEIPTTDNNRNNNNSNSSANSSSDNDDNTAVCASTTCNDAHIKCNDSSSRSDSASRTTADTHLSHDRHCASTTATASLVTAAIVSAACAPSTSCPDLGVDTSPRFSNDGTGTATDSNLDSYGNPNNTTDADTNISNSNNNISFVNITCTFSVDAVTSSASNINSTPDAFDSNNSNAAGIVDTAHMFSTPTAGTTPPLATATPPSLSLPSPPACSVPTWVASTTTRTTPAASSSLPAPSPSKRPDTLDINFSAAESISSSANVTSPIRTAPSTTARNDEPEPKRTGIPPFVDSHQVPPLVPPPPDKPEEPPPTPPKDATPAAPKSQVVQATCTIGLVPARPLHLLNDMCTPFSGKPPRFALQVEDFGDGKHL